MSNKAMQATSLRAEPDCHRWVERIEDMKKAVLALSVILNFILIVLIIVGIRYSRCTAFRTVAEATAAEVRLQEYFLKELESGDTRRIEALKEMMRRNIKNGKQASATWESAAKW